MAFKYFTAFFWIIIFGSSCLSSQPLTDNETSDFVDINTLVIRYEKKLRIENKNKAYLRVKIHKKILNKESKEEGFLVLFYDKFRKIKRVEGWVLDASGNRVKKLSKSNIDDYSNISSFSLYEDSRVRTYQLYHDELPYSVVYEYELELNSLLNLPTWMPQTNENEYVKESSFQVAAPNELKINVKEENFKGTYNFSELDNEYIHEWKIQDLNTFEREKFSPPTSWKLPKVTLSADEFEIDKYAGKLDSWRSFGKWYHELSKGKDDIPDKTKNEIDTLIQGINSDKEKARVLYDYMQQKSRYISIQLGIGGWEPFPASFVEDTGYGDCKALTNYMYSILKYAGIKSHPALINSGRYAIPVDKDFPRNQFNHVILHVPLQNDTLWLECTSQKFPFNYIGNNNSARKALLITPEGGKLTDTPEYGSDVNQQIIYTDIEINDKGHAYFKVDAIYDGFYMEQLVYDLGGLSGVKQKEILYKKISLNTFEISNLDVSEIEEKKKPTSISYDLITQSYASSLGNRLFVPIKGLGYNSINLPADSARTQPLLFRFEFTNEDSLNLIYPDNYYVEAKPEEITIDNDILFYELSFSDYPKLNKVTIRRKLILKNREIEASKYERIKQSFDTITRFDNQEIVLNKNNR